VRAALAGPCAPQAGGGPAGTAPASVTRRSAGGSGPAPSRGRRGTGLTWTWHRDLPDRRAPRRRSGSPPRAALSTVPGRAAGRRPGARAKRRRVSLRFRVIRQTGIIEIPWQARAAACTGPPRAAAPRRRARRRGGLSRARRAASVLPVNRDSGRERSPALEVASHGAESDSDSRASAVTPSRLRVGELEGHRDGPTHWHGPAPRRRRSLARVRGTARVSAGESETGLRLRISYER
jgi:hypothetical protein